MNCTDDKNDEEGYYDEEEDLYVTGMATLINIVVSLLCKGFRCTMPHKNFSSFYMYVNYQVFIT